MVADDLAIMTTTPGEMQTALKIAEHDGARERYIYIYTMRNRQNPSLSIAKQT